MPQQAVGKPTANTKPTKTRVVSNPKKDQVTIDLSTGRRAKVLVHKWLTTDGTNFDKVLVQT